MGELEVLILELLAVDRLPTRTVSVREVSTLTSRLPQRGVARSASKQSGTVWNPSNERLIVRFIFVRARLLEHDDFHRFTQRRRML